MEWVVEQGIGEERALLIGNGTVYAARIHWPGALTSGQVIDAKLISRTGGSSRGTAETGAGQQVLVDKLPKNATEGVVLRLEITRSAIHEKGRIKLAHARPSDAPLRPAPSLAESLIESTIATGYKVSTTRSFPAGLWEDIWHDAWGGTVSFAQGTLVLYDAPAMTLIDIDGADSPFALSRAAAPEIARAIFRLDLNGAIGIDFPTLSDKAQRKKIDHLLGELLADWPHERTAMNGFGFVQIVSRKDRPSLLSQIGGSRRAAAARFLLRQAERLDDSGDIGLVIPPALNPHFDPDTISILTQRTGRKIHVSTDPTLALEGGYAQTVVHDNR